MKLGATYFALAGIFIVGATLLIPDSYLLGHLLLLPAAGLAYLGSQELTNPRHLGIAYLGTSVLLVLVGVYLGLDLGDGDFIVGDLLLLASLVFIYLGSTSLAEDNEATAEEDTETADAE